jgi:hypothetical protein
VLAVWFAFILIVVTATFVLRQTTGQQFVIEAESFLAGRLDQIRPDERNFHIDTTIVEGKYYWPLGPFPAMLLTPIVLVFKTLGLTLLQGYVHFVLCVGTGIYAYLIARKFKFSINAAIFLAIAFNFGSMFAFISFYSQSWFFSHAVAAFLTMAGIYEYFYGKRRLSLIGILFGFIYMTRSTAALPVIFFVIDIWRSDLPRRQRINQILALMIPVGILVVVMMTLNQIRFGSIMDVGYGRAQVYPEILVNMRNEFGLFSIQNIVSNIYIYFFMGPDPVFAKDSWHLVSPYLRYNPIGMSFFIVAPLFTRILIHWKKLRSGKTLWMFLATLPSVFILLCYYASGFWSYGPRYLIDVLPFWYLLLLHTYTPTYKLSKWHYRIILFSVFINIYFITHQASQLYWRVII